MCNGAIILMHTFYKIAKTFRYCIIHKKNIYKILIKKVVQNEKILKYKYHNGLTFVISGVRQLNNCKANIMPFVVIQYTHG